MAESKYKNELDEIIIDAKNEIKRISDSNEPKITEIGGDQILDKIDDLLKHYHIELVEKLYTTNTVEDDSDYIPDYLFNNWVDIEGVDYGWYWLYNDNKGKDAREELCKMIQSKVKDMIVNQRFIKSYLTTEGVNKLYIVECEVIESEDGYSEYLERKDTILTFSDHSISIFS